MQIVARSLLWVACCALLGAGLARTASAATVTVVMTGTWSTVADTAAVLDGSITAGGSFTATFTYDDSVSDVNSLGETGDYLMNGNLGVLNFSTGNYSFIDQGVSLNGITVDDDNAGTDAIYLFFDRYLASGTLPSGVGLTPLAYTNPSLIDYSETTLSSDRLTDLIWDASRYDTDFYFFGPISGRGAQDYIEFDGVITNLQVVIPEPSLLALVGLGIAGLGLRRRFR